MGTNEGAPGFPNSGWHASAWCTDNHTSRGFAMDTTPRRGDLFPTLGRSVGQRSHPPGMTVLDGMGWMGTVFKDAGALHGRHRTGSECAAVVARRFGLQTCGRLSASSRRDRDRDLASIISDDGKLGFDHAAIGALDIPHDQIGTVGLGVDRASVLSSYHR